MTKTTEALAREAGIIIEPRFGLASTGNAQLARFEALVRADERAKVIAEAITCIENQEDPYDQPTPQMVADAVRYLLR